MKINDLQAYSKKELTDLAKKHNLQGYSKLSKTELTKLLSSSISGTSSKSPRTQPKTSRAKTSRAKKAKTASATTVMEHRTDHSCEQACEQEQVEVSKFYIGRQEPKTVYEDHFVFPKDYGKTRIVLMVRDPYWMYCYWDITDDAVTRLKDEMGESLFSSSRMVLRVKDVTNEAPEKASSYFDIDIAYGATNWYINIQADNRSYCVELGYKTPDNVFYMLVRSNTVMVPRASVSDKLDESWAEIEDYDRMYALSGGFDPRNMSSAEIRELMEKRLKEWITSGAPSSMGSAQIKPISETFGKKRSFFLVVDTELIVYGVTMPDASLTIQGRPKKLNPDGTFTARFSLPDGKQVIPVTAVSSDKIDTITITPVVTKETN